MRRAVGSSDRITSGNRAAFTSSKQRLVSLEVQFADVRWMPQGAPVFGELGSHWGVIEASTVALPFIGLEPSDWSRHRRVLVRGSPF